MGARHVWPRGGVVGRDQRRPRKPAGMDEPGEVGERRDCVGGAVRGGVCGVCWRRGAHDGKQGEDAGDGGRGRGDRGLW